MSMRRIGSLSFVAVLGACGLLPSPPEPMPVNCYLAEAGDVDSVRRVMVLPFHAVAGVQAKNEAVRVAFINELTKTQRFEVVPLPDRDEEHQEIYRHLTRGEIATDSLVALSRRYQIDGAVIGTITSYRAYPPPHLGLRVQMLSLHSGQTVWAADGLYDSNDNRVVEDLRHYAGSFLAEEDSLHGWEINLMSPAKYASYVSHRLVGTWRHAEVSARRREASWR